MSNIQPAPSHVEEAGYAIAEADRYPTEAKRALAAAQAHATLALVEVAERLAVAQETANLIAFVAHIDSIGDPVGNPSPEVLNAAKEAGRRAVKAMGL